MKKILQRLIFWTFIGLPIASLLINAISWLRFGLDLPLYDDWRGYITGQMNSLDLKYLFRPVNDTMTPIGFALDSLAQRYLDGNSIAYQFISMIVVLGGLLLLQWHLLIKALRDRQLAAICFVFTILMMQPGSYWGQQNMAYHQALPLLFILSALALLLNEKASDIWRMPLIFVLSLMAGFSYISGAFGVLAIGLSLLLIWWLSDASTFSKPLQQGSLLFTSSGVFSSLIQFSYAIPGLVTHKSAAPMAYPTDSGFWLFFLGKIGRSLALPQSYPILSLSITLAVCFTILLLGLSFASKKTFWHTSDRSNHLVGVIFFELAVLILVYLAMVAAGRVNMREPNVTTPTQIFLYGFERFHFFWATLLWPWLVAGLIISWKALLRPKPTTVVLVTTVVTLLLVSLMFAGGVFSHETYYRAATLYRLPTLTCLSEKLQLGERIDCPEFFNPDFRGAYAYGRSTGASFIRHFPIFPIPIGSDKTPSWYSFARNKGGVTLKNASLIEKDGSQLANSDAQMWFKTGKVSSMRECLLLEVNAIIQTTQLDMAQLYYRSPSRSEFTELESQQLAIEPNQMQHLSYQVWSPSGFADDLRLDPVAKAQRFKVWEVEVRCRFSLLPHGAE